MVEVLQDMRVAHKVEGPVGEPVRTNSGTVRFGRVFGVVVRPPELSECERVPAGADVAAARVAEEAARRAGARVAGVCEHAGHARRARCAPRAQTQKTLVFKVGECEMNVVITKFPGSTTRW